MNSYRRGLRNSALVNLNLFLLEKVNLGQSWSSVLKTCIIWYESLQLGTVSIRKEVIGKDWSGRASRVRLVIHVRPPTSEGHNFFVRTPIRVFLDSMESPLSQESIHI